MPTLILMDRSLSMGRRIVQNDQGAATIKDEDVQSGGKGHGSKSFLNCSSRLALAQKIVTNVVDYLEEHLPYEYVSMMTFSDDCETLVEFSNNDHNLLRDKIWKTKLGDRTDISKALSGAYREVKSHFGPRSTSQIIVVTDSAPPSHIQTEVLNNILCKVHIILLGNAKELERSLGFQTISRRSGGAYIPISTNDNSHGSNDHRAENKILDFLGSHFAPFHGKLCFGNLTSLIRLYPPPSASVGSERTLPTTINICGFIFRDQIGSPAVLSRHIVMPPHSRKDAVPIGNPDFRRLLFLALESDNLIAVARLAPSWFALVHPSSEGKKQNLMISVLDHGANIPWLGDLASIVDAKPKTQVSIWLQKKGSEDSQNEILLPQDPPSYVSFSESACPTVRSSKQLQQDIARVLRLAATAESKRVAFFRDFNKIRSALLTFGMQPLLDKVLEVLQRLQNKKESGISNGTRKILENVLKQCNDVKNETESTLEEIKDTQNLGSESNTKSTTPTDINTKINSEKGLPPSKKNDAPKPMSKLKSTDGKFDDVKKPINESSKHIEKRKDSKDVVKAQSQKTPETLDRPSKKARLSSVPKVKQEVHIESGMRHSPVMGNIAISSVPAHPVSAPGHIPMMQPVQMVVGNPMSQPQPMYQMAPMIQTQAGHFVPVYPSNMPMYPMPVVQMQADHGQVPVALTQAPHAPQAQHVYVQQPHGQIYQQQQQPMDMKRKMPPK
eukprot:m.89517 g.89517  ORF g.89517 m.89517 type:complete len:727 (-) comp13226_c0_seq4:53-2233(-)